MVSSKCICGVAGAFIATLRPPIAHPVWASLRSSLATTSTFAPCSVAAMAARSPDPPEPIIRMSVSILWTVCREDTDESPSLNHMNELILAPGLDRDRGKVFLDYRLDEQPCLFDFGKQGDIMVNGITSQGIIVVHFFAHMPVDDIDSEVNFIVAEVGED